MSGKLRRSKSIQRDSGGESRSAPWHFYESYIPPCGTKSGTDKRFPKKPVSLTLGERCECVCVSLNV